MGGKERACQLSTFSTSMFFINGGIWGYNHNRAVTTILLAAYHVISWRDMNKCLFTSDVTSVADHRNNSICVQLSEPEESWVSQR